MMVAVEIICLSSLAMACDFTDAREQRSVTAEEFFALPIGAVAMGGDCDARSRTCTRFYDIRNCNKVVFPVALSGMSQAVAIAFNTMSPCQVECSWVDSFLQTIVLYPPNPEFADFIDLFRNYSSRWDSYNGRNSTRQECCREPNPLTPEAYFAGDGRGLAEDRLFDTTSLPWHSIFTPTYTAEGVAAPQFWDPAWGQTALKTWEVRNFFLDELAKCAGCSAKLMMMRFRETLAGGSLAAPTTPLVQTFKVMNYPFVQVRSRVPLSQNLYDTAFDLELIR